MPGHMGRRFVLAIPLLLVIASRPSMGHQDAPAPPPLGDDTPTLCPEPQSCIEQLAGANILNKIFSDENGDTEAQVTTFVWSARSFSRQSDFYMVNQYVRSYLAPTLIPTDWQTYLEVTLVSPDITPTPTSIVPQNTTCDTQVVNDTTTSFTGSVGLTSIGPEVGVGESNSWSQQSWTVCPSLTIVQAAVPPTVSWDYVLGSDTGTTAFSDEAFVMTQQWVWEIPWTALADATSGISFSTLVQVQADENIQVNETFTMKVPAPFDQFEIPAPQLDSATPSTVTAGSVFTLSGAWLYPTGITGLFIAGNALDPSLWFPVQDGNSNKIIVITPNNLIPGRSYPIEVETAGGVASGVSIEVTR